MADNPLVKIDIGDLSRPATVLIEKISDALGGMARPFQMVRVAKAEAKVAQIQAEAEIEVTDLHRRALSRFIQEEAQRQLNIESIIKKALPLLEDTSEPSELENDWIAHFFDKNRIVSDQDMQLIWSRILAGEANKPRTYSRRTINALSDMDKGDALSYTALCAICWKYDNQFVPLVFDLEQSPLYETAGVSFESVQLLEGLGLVQHSGITDYSFVRLPKRISMSYFGRSVDMTLPKDSDNELNIGSVILTRAGRS